MSFDAWFLACALSALAYWLGWRRGWKAGISRVSELYWHRFGVRDFDTATRTLHFSDGTKHTHEDSNDDR